MPTAAKLVAAVTFALVAAIAAQMYVPALPEGAQVGWFREICAAVGFICGWRTMGRLVGRGYGEAMGAGVRTAIVMAFWLVLGFAINEMLYRATKMRYGGSPMEAVLAVFDLMLYYARLMVTPEVIGTLLIGGVAGGLLAEAAGRRWS